MLLINKLAVFYLPLASFSLSLQTAASVLILLVGRETGHYEFPGFDSGKARAWIGVMAAWLAPMLVNMKALQYSTVETVIIFRILSTFGVAIGDYFLFEVRFSAPALVTMAVTVGGGVLYGLNDANFTVAGYFWGLLYFSATIFNALYIKLMFNRVSVSMSNVEKTYYNNLMAIPLLLVISIATEDWGSVPVHLTNMTLTGWCCIALSCFMGTAISMCGTACRDLLSATSFNIAGNLNKFLTILMSVAFLETRIVAQSAIGLFLALSGGAAYAFVK